MESSNPHHRMYSDLASWWPLLSPPDEYEEEAAFYARTMIAQSRSPVRSVLELGSGGGSNAFHLKRQFAMTLVDPSPGMLAVSRAVNPECEHVEGDMRTIRLGRQFDAVFIHDAICYMTTEDDLERALLTAYVHCSPAGAAIFAPDFILENFRESTDHGGVSRDGRAMRYLEWTHDPDPDDSTCTVDYAYILREADGSVRVEHDRHIEGLFARDTWLRTLEKVGFEADVVPFRHSEYDADLEVMVGRRGE